MLYAIAVMLASLLVLAKSSHLVISNAIRLARTLGIGELAAGFVLVSVSTSLPELSVSVLAASRGEGAISFGNVMGANISDITLVLGVSALIAPVMVHRRELVEVVRVLFITSFIPLLLMNTTGIGLFGGALLLLTFFAYVFFLGKKEVHLQIEHANRAGAARSLALFMLGVAGVLLSSKFVVDSALSIAADFSLAKSFIAATVVSLGTTLPELAVNVAAMRRGNHALALGNAVGSSMTNLTLVLGSAAIISNVSLVSGMFSTLVTFLLVSNLLLWYFVDGKRRIAQFEGVLLLCVYVVFLIASFSAARL